MPKVKRIRIELFLGNRNLIDVHVTAQVSSESLHGGFLGGSRLNPFKQLSLSGEKTELSEDTKATIMNFYDIDGIDSVGIEPNKVRLERSPAYDWEDLVDDVVDTVKKVVNWTEDDVQVDYLFVGRVTAEPASPETIQAEIDRQEAESRRYEAEQARWDRALGIPHDDY